MRRVVVSHGGYRPGGDSHGGFQTVRRITHHHDRGKPNFIVELQWDIKRYATRKEIDVIIEECRESLRNCYRCGNFPAVKEVALRLYVNQWKDALDMVITFWSKRLEGVHVFNPKVLPNVFVCSEEDEMRDKLKGLFVRYIKEKLLDGETVRKLGKEIDSISDEIAKIQGLLKLRHVSLWEFNEHTTRKDELVEERNLIKKRLTQFREAMNCILGYLQGLHVEGNGYSVEADVYRLNKDFDWSRIHYVLMRECRRLEENLPIYTSRLKILQEVRLQQVIVLIGETGSGKSTQLVQYLADSGLVGEGSIVCTQPRKIAALSLAQRVEEESMGCYDDNSISCCQFYSSVQKFKSKIIFMTDHCLLQHYMSDDKLAWVSCIIVDEAHERSLNTDLLLALIKGLLLKRPELKLIIMSATADADKLSAYFFGCVTVHVLGRNYPVDIEYVPSEFSEAFSTMRQYSGNCPPYVSEVVKIATRIHETEEEGAILAFLTSGAEVDWACENLSVPGAIGLPLHGKLSSNEQSRVFQKYPGQRKIIFATNIAETSLTIPGVKYVVDSGMVKEGRFEPSTGMNVLKVCRVSQSSANQRAGRAGRTEPGKCYRLYSEFDFQSMLSHQEPEIQRVHLGVAVLRILSVGVKDIQEFDFVDAPNPKAIDRAIKNLIHLGAISIENGVYIFTETGRNLVKLGIEPQLGKLILDSIHFHLRREGVVLAAVMANASTIFCRFGNEEDKLKSDCFKVKFCHHNGDLFTLLSVYQEWENVSPEKKNEWCWTNSINAKSMRRCKDIVHELECCLKNDLGIIVPGYWLWKPGGESEHDRNLKKVILTSFAENIAMYSGHDRLGYQVALTGKHVHLHPSCSLLVYGQKPDWVVFGELISVPHQYLVCVTAFDYGSLFTVSPPPPFDISQMERRRLQMALIAGSGNTVMRRFCGKASCSLHRLISRLQITFKDERIDIKVTIDNQEVQVFASSEDIKMVCAAVKEALNHEKKWLTNECIDKLLCRGGPSAPPSVALFGAGAEIKHLELGNRYLAVEVISPNASALDDKELLMMFEERVGGISGFHKYGGNNGQDREDSDRWGRIMFLAPGRAETAVVDLNGAEFGGSLLKVLPSYTKMGSDHKTIPDSGITAKISWPRKYSNGIAFVTCAVEDAQSIIDDCSNLLIGRNHIVCELSKKDQNSVAIRQLDREVSEPELSDILRTVTSKTILDVHVVRGKAVSDLTCAACEEALLREIAPFMPSRIPLTDCCRVRVFPPNDKDRDYSVRACITFYGGLYLEAAKALDSIRGKVLPGCLSWQKIQCQQCFDSSVSCPAAVYSFISKDLDSLFESFNKRNDVSYVMERLENGYYRVKLSANATRTLVELRRPLEELMKGKIIDHAALTPRTLQLLCSLDGISLIRSIQRETGTYILHDKQRMNVRVFGTKHKVTKAENRLVESLVSLREQRQPEIRLRGSHLPYDLMKEVVLKFGPDLHGLKQKVPGAGITLNIRRHVVSVQGNEDMKKNVEEMICDIARSLAGNLLSERSEGEESACPICLCELEESYQLEACSHRFCRTCLVEQIESAIRNQDSFPICCAHVDCKNQILLTDLKSLVSSEKLDELFRASVGAFVASSGGTYRFCPSPDCPAVYRVADAEEKDPAPFLCGACYVETCRKCHLEYHACVTCEAYKVFKDDPDSSLYQWKKGKEYVKACPKCRFTIEKGEGCNHVECRCGVHICWECLESFQSSEDCYNHLRDVHKSIV